MPLPPRSGVQVEISVALVFARNEEAGEAAVGAEGRVSPGEVGAAGCRQESRPGRPQGLRQKASLQLARHQVRRQAGAQQPRALTTPLLLHSLYTYLFIHSL